MKREGCFSWRQWTSARLAVCLLVAGAAAPIAVAQDIGFEGPAFTGAGATPTEAKPQSKLWFNDGQWWGSLWSSSGSAFRIHRLNFTTHVWADTGVAIDSRANSHSDALWDGTKLYIISHQFVANGGSSGNPILVYRYSYNSTTDVYSLDAGFPVTIGDFSTEAAVIAKDSAGVVWAVWTQSLRVRISHTLASDTQWSTSVVLPTNTANINIDDICSILSYGGNRIGVLWSDQSVNAYRFSFHVDGAADTAWSTVENATTGETDDHLNMKAHSDGRVFVAGKNAANNLLLLVRATNGTWSRFVITQPTPILTRPIVILDEPGNLIRVFATGQDTGEVFEKTSPISSISFGAGTGTIRMRDESTVFRISNPTSSKQNVSGATGFVVLAHHDTTGFYWHHDVAPLPPVADFTAAPTSGAAPLAVNFTDASTGSITSRSWSFGDGGTSTATSPSHTYTAAGSYTVSLTATGPGGSDTETKADFITVTVPPPVADFTGSPTSGQAPLDVSFTNASTGSITSRSWSFGDGGTSTATSPSHTYTAAGAYTVSLTVTGPGGSDTETKTNYINVSVQQAPLANFGASPTSGTAPLEVTFTDASTGGISSRSWSFGDGGTSTATNPVHTYLAAGTYTVSLTVDGPGGTDTETKTDLIVVSQPGPPVASFDAAPTSGAAPLDVQFTDTSSGGVTAWSWDFGDGGTSAAQNPLHSYVTQGTFTVSLTVTGPGGTDGLTQVDLIEVTPPLPIQTLLPVADARVNEASPNSNAGTATELRVRLEAGGSYHSYLRFDLGSVTQPIVSAKLRLFCTDASPVGGLVFPTSNGWTETGINWTNKPAATGGQIGTLGAVETGAFVEVNLTGVSGGGLVSFLMTSTSSNSALYSSREGTNPPQLVIETGQPAVPVAGFSASPLTGTAPLVVTFTDASTGDITSRSWNFGDGGTSTATNPLHTYAAVGSYTVSLTVSGPGGQDTETKADFIVVSTPPPVAGFSATPTSGTAPLQVAFTDASTGSITSRSWSFGDGGTSTATSPSHTYTAAGSYTVSLTVNGPGGQDTETKTDFIVVTTSTPPVVADFTATPTSGVVPLEVAFTDASTGSVTSRSWSFGDGGTSTATNPSHTYTVAGTYTVSLTVQGPGGPDTETKTNYIVVSPPPPVAGFTATPTSGTAPLQVAFTDASTGTITSRSWSFGDGGTSTATSPSHTYAAAGTFTVSLTVSGPGGQDTETKIDLVSVTAPAAPVANFSAAPTSGIAPLNVAFTDTSTGSVTSRLWSFGDGTTSTAQHPSHTFGVGTFTVSLAVTGPGGTDDLTRVDLIHVTAPPGSLTLQPVADARVGEGSPGSNYGPSPELRVRSAAGGSVHTYLRFDLTGVGAVVSARLRLFCTDESPVGGLVFPTSNGWNESGTNGINWSNKPAATGAQLASIGPAAAGTWVEVDVSSAVPGGSLVSFLLTSTSSNSVLYASRETANRPELVVVTGAAVPPVAEFSASPLSGQAPLTVAFTDLSTGIPTTWSWGFGDGGTSALTNPTHVFTAPGAYSVTLEVANEAGSAQITKTDLVVVSPAPPSTVRHPVADARVGEGSPGSNFGTSPELRVRSAAGGSVHTYLRFDLTGVGTVVSAKLRLFCTDASPVGGLVFPTSSGWSETGINWSNKPAATGAQIASIGPAATNTWKEVDVSSAVSAGNLVSFLLTSTTSDSALYASRETANRPELVVVTGTAPVPPVAQFSATPLSGTPPLTVSFTDQSTGGPTSWSWDFGDGGTSSAQSPTHVYTAPGSFTVTLVASNAGGSSNITKPSLVSVGSPSPTNTYLPVADARVNEGSPSSNAGTATELRVRFEAGGSYHSYLRFDLTGLSGTVTSAKLRLFCTDGSPVGGLFFPTSNGWTETSVNWNNKPAATGGQIASVGTVATGAWVEIDVTSAIVGPGLVNFLMTTTSSNSALYSSREGTNRPELIVTTGGP